MVRRIHQTHTHCTLCTIEHMANLAPTFKDFEDRAQAILSKFKLWSAEQNGHIIIKMTWVAVWKDA